MPSTPNATAVLAALPRSSPARTVGLARLVSAMALLLGSVGTAAPPARPTAPPQRPAAPPPAQRGDAARPPVRQRPVAPAAEATVNLPPVRLEPATIDFGFVAPKSQNRGVTKLWNTGDTPLEIVAVQPSCKCTTTDDIVGKVIAPGEHVELSARLDAAAAPGAKSADVRVLFDGYDSPVIFRLRSEVSLPIRITPGYINAARGGAEQGRLVVESIDRRPFTICSAGGRPPRIAERVSEPKARYLLDYDLADFPAGEIPRFFVIETDHPDCPLADILVRHDSLRLAPGIRGCRDLKINGGAFEPGSSVDLSVEFNRMAEAVEFTGAGVRHEGLSVELLGVRDEGEGDEFSRFVDLRVSAKPELRGLIVTDLLLHAGEKTHAVMFFVKVAPAGSGCE